MEENIVYIRGRKRRYCTKCGRYKLIEKFGKNKRYEDGMQPYCKECISTKPAEAKLGRLIRKLKPEDIAMVENFIEDILIQY